MRIMCGLHESNAPLVRRRAVSAASDERLSSAFEVMSSPDL